MQTTRRQFLKALGTGALAMMAPGVARRALAAPADRPNVVFILADDLGWTDTAVYGSQYYQTPNIDALAKRGMLFSNAYAANPLCSPTRASILTGLWPARIGITAPVCHVPEVKLNATLPAKAGPTQKALTASSATRLKLEYYTLAEAFKAAGYTTGHFGKWHLGPEPYDPLHQGFDVDIPHTPAPSPLGDGFLAPWPVWPGVGMPGEHLEDRMAQEAARFIREKKGGPFLLDYWCFSVHSPWQAKPELIEKYRKLMNPENPQHNPVYAAMVQSMDEAVGTLMQTLQDEGLIDKTLVIFFSDNGGWIWATSGHMPAEYHTVPVTNSAPLRGGKATIYEGGTREPLIVAWPGQIAPDTRNDEAIVTSVDFYPTLVEICGLEPQPGQHFDGVSILPALKGQPLQRDTIFCHFPHATSATGGLPSTFVRQGDWKLIRFFCDNDDQTDRFELYNLKEDIGESKNLAEAMPEKVAALNALISTFLAETHAVVPQPNPNFNLASKP